MGVGRAEGAAELGVEEFFLAVGVVEATVGVVTKGIAKGLVGECLENIALGDFCETGVIQVKNAVSEL